MIIGVAKGFWELVLAYVADNGHSFKWPKGYISKKEGVMINAFSDALIKRNSLETCVMAAKMAAFKAGFRLTTAEEAAIIDSNIDGEMPYLLGDIDALTSHPR